MNLDLNEIGKHGYNELRKQKCIPDADISRREVTMVGMKIPGVSHYSQEKVEWLHPWT